LTVVAVNLDSKRTNADKFLAQHPVTFKIAFDSMGSTAKVYKIKGMPSSYLINRLGNIVSSHIGFQEKETKKIEKEIVDQLGQ
jgi:peroxiredoxin